MTAFRAMWRAVKFVYRCIRFRSISSARWVDEYEQFKPTHGRG